jgi:hypothetical protein
MKTKYIIIGLVIILLVLFITQKKEHSGSVTPSAPQLSNEAIQNIARIYADTNNTATFNNLNTTGDITVSGDIKGNGAKKIIDTIRLNTIDNRKPVILTIQIGSSKLPIVDLTGNTFPSDKWLCRLISVSANNPIGSVIGIRNGKWWIANFGGWNTWQQATVEFTPINIGAEDYYDLKSGFHPSITIDTAIDFANTNSHITGAATGTGPANNGYFVYSSESRRFVAVAPPLS